MSRALAVLVLLTAVQDKYRVEEGNGRLARTIHVDRSTLALAATPDGAVLAIGSGSEILLAGLPDGKLLRSVKCGPGFVRGLAFSADGKTIAAAVIGGVVLVDVATGALLWRIAGHPAAAKGDEGAYGVAFSPDGAQVLTISRDDTKLRSWALKDGAAGAVVDTQLVGPKRLAVGGGRVAVLSDDGVAGFGADLAPLWKQKGRLLGALAYSPDGTSLALGTTGASASVRLLDAATGEKKGQLDVAGLGTPSGVAWTPDGKRVVTAATRGGVLLWNGGTSVKLDESFKAGEDLDRAVVVVLGGKLAAVAGNRKEIRLYTLGD